MSKIKKGETSNRKLLIAALSAITVADVKDEFELGKVNELYRLLSPVKTRKRKSTLKSAEKSADAIAPSPKSESSI